MEREVYVSESQIEEGLDPTERTKRNVCFKELNACTTTDGLLILYEAAPVSGDFRRKVLESFDKWMTVDTFVKNGIFQEYLVS